MSTANHGHGALVTFGGTNIGNIVDINGPDQSVDSIDISTMESAGKAMEFIPGMIDNGEVSLALNFDGATDTSANAQLLQAQVTQTSAQALVIQYGDHSTPTNAAKFECSAFITGLGAVIPSKSKVDQNVTFKLTGQKTFTGHA
jgi:hypothetical protein